MYLSGGKPKPSYQAQRPPSAPTATGPSLFSRLHHPTPASHADPPPSTNVIQSFTNLETAFQGTIVNRPSSGPQTPASHPRDSRSHSPSSSNSTFSKFHHHESRIGNTSAPYLWFQSSPPVIQSPCPAGAKQPVQELPTDGDRTDFIAWRPQSPDGCTSVPSCPSQVIGHALTPLDAALGPPLDVTPPR